MKSQTSLFYPSQLAVEALRARWLFAQGCYASTNYAKMDYAKMDYVTVYCRHKLANAHQESRGEPHGQEQAPNS